MQEEKEILDKQENADDYIVAMFCSSIKKVNSSPEIESYNKI